MVGSAAASSVARCIEDGRRVERWPAARCATGSHVRNRRTEAATPRCARHGRRLACGGSRDRRARPGWRRSSATSASGRARAATRSSPAGGRRQRVEGRGCGPACGGGDPTRGRASTREGVLELREIAHGGDAAVVQLRRGLRTDAPQSLDPQGMQERELAIGWHHEQAVGLGDTARNLGEELGARHSHGDAQAHLVEDVARAARSRCRWAYPTMRRRPPTSRNASSMDRPSTSGVVFAKTSNTALLASEYADIRGSTVTAQGHSRRGPACRSSRCARHTPSPRSSRPARPRRPR